MNKINIWCNIIIISQLHFDVKLLFLQMAYNVQEQLTTLVSPV